MAMRTAYQALGNELFTNAKFLFLLVHDILPPTMTIPSASRQISLHPAIGQGMT